MNELPINISSIIDKLPEFQIKLLSINNDNIDILYNIITEIYEIKTEKLKTEKHNKLQNFIMNLYSYNLLNNDHYNKFKDDIIIQLIQNKYNDDEVINYIFNFIENQIKEINSKDSDKLNKIVNDNIDIYEEDFEETDEEDYEDDFEETDDYEKIPEKIKDTSTKINDVLRFLKNLCGMLIGNRSNTNLINLKNRIDKIDRKFLNDINRESRNHELKIIFINTNKTILSEFINHISNSLNDTLFQSYYTIYNITKEDIIEVLNKFINKEIKAGKKKKKGKRILKKYKK